MSRKKTLIKWSLIIFATLIISTVAFGFWFMSLIKPSETTEIDISKAAPTDLSYLTADSIPVRGKILAVVTSCGVMGDNGKPTGYELTELSRAYYVFMANGFEVDIASPLGGKPPVVIDDEDMGVYDYAFLNDTIAQIKVDHTIAIKDVTPDDYQAVYFVGGKGTMFDFPDNKYIQSLVRQYYDSGKVIGAVCHGPAALINVTLNGGQHLVANRKISGFTNEEELFLIPDAPDIFPFLLQDKLVEKGARFDRGSMYLENVVQDGSLVTGQNPWSTWKVAGQMIEQMGYVPKKREKTTEENAVEILNVYGKIGYAAARKHIDEFHSNGRLVNRELVAVHSIVAAMQWKLGNAVALIRLLAYAKSIEQK
ncbi:ThiJ/PfpI family protein [Fulvivirga imtechensis AK7]|uniref:ThiJ/PfpI family protein n=1 Tax=Fulvivirga imtechensis AK7 TaxID=1237149 RepID=L8K1T9_9BACT|nr:type 1 glutamine amidotransferase domain-containing protein [Fulvivirga imtechensis]ELR73422.1 ThiJ/PfpI family protein [Fulvivirga imtechensis AK7]